jgi:hypothetical protein
MAMRELSKEEMQRIGTGYLLSRTAINPAGRVITMSDESVNDWMRTDYGDEDNQ